MRYAIQTSGLTKSFPKTSGWRNLFIRKFDAPAVENISFSVGRGEIFGLVGPNGAGKTTLIKMLTTLILPTSGSAQVNGYDLADEINIKRTVGMVTSDERSFFWRLTGQQNLEFFAALNGLLPVEIPTQVENALKLVDLQPVAEKRFNAYSTGMRQRLSIARALLTEPQILFLDEPTKGLDPATTHQFRELIIGRLIQEQGLTIFMTSHRLDEVERICDRVAILNRGKIQACGTLNELREQLESEEKFQLVVKGWSPGIQTTLQDWVPDLAVSDLENESKQLTFKAGSDSDELDNVIDSLLQSDCKIREISKTEISLDEIFQQYTQAKEPDSDFSDDTPIEDLVIQSISDPHKSRSSIKELFQVAGAFLRRDFLSEISYRASFFLQFFNIIFAVAVYYFLAEMFGDFASPFLEPYGGDYFSFVLIGIAFAGYFSVGLSSFSNSLRRAQTTGTLEAMLSTPTRLSTIILSSSQWSYLLTTFRVVAYIFVGTVFLNVEISGSNMGIALLILFLTVVSFSSLGIIAASFIMVLKRGDPIAWIFGTFSSLLGGVYYPIDVMPEWMQFFSNLLPVTYALRAMRLALLQNAGFQELSLDILALVAFSVILLPVSLLLFRYAVKRARSDGSLTHY